MWWSETLKMRPLEISTSRDGWKGVVVASSPALLVGWLHRLFGTPIGEKAPGLGWPAAADLFAAVVGAFVGIIIHELAHATVGRLTGRTVKQIRIGSGAKHLMVTIR